MLERESALTQAGRIPQRGLVYPVIYSDGDHFHPRAKDTQVRRNLSAFTYPYPCFKHSVAYLPFHDAMMEIAREIENHLAGIPEWEADWPVIEPENTDVPYMTLPRP